MNAKAKIQNQENLFKSRLDQILNNKHPMFVLANQIDWDSFGKEFGEYYCGDNGLDRNYPMGDEGDRINAIFAGCGANLRKAYSPDKGGVLRAILLVPDIIQSKIVIIWQVIKNIDSGKLTAQIQVA